MTGARYAGRMPLIGSRPGRLGDGALTALAFLAAVPAGCALGLALYRFPLPAALVIAAGVAMVAVLALALASYHAAVALGFLLLGVAIFEPAPADGVFLVAIAVAAASGRFHLSWVPRSVVGILAVFGALSLMSAVDVADVGRAATYFGVTLYLALFALWLPGYVVSSGRARLVVNCYLAAAVASTIVGVLALVAPLPGADLFTMGGRARALFQDPNVFGPFLIPAALILGEEIVRPRLLHMRLLTKALLLGVLLVGVLFSFSRGAWLNLAIAFAVLGAVLALRGGARQVLGLIAVGLVAAAVLAGAVVVTGSGEFLTERAKPQTYDTERFSGQRAGLGSAQEYPLGAGPGQFESVASISAHSTYARALGEQGFPGLLLIFALLGGTLAIALSNAAAARDTHGIGSAALLAAWCGLLANSAFIDTLHWRHLWIVAALIWAGSAAAYTSSGTSAGARTGVHAGSA
jgi:O-antigen ligase